MFLHIVLVGSPGDNTVCSGEGTSLSGHRPYDPMVSRVRHHLKQQMVFVRLEKSCTLSQLRQAIAAKTGVAPQQQFLCLKGKQLGIHADTKCLYQCGVEDGATISCTVRFVGEELNNDSAMDHAAASGELSHHVVL